MSALDYLKDAYELLKKAQQVEAANRVMDARAELVDLKEQNLQLREDVGALKEQLKIKGQLAVEKNRYFLVEGGKKDGPFCTRCWDGKDKLLVRLHRSRQFQDHCPNCKTAVEGM